MLKTPNLITSYRMERIVGGKILDSSGNGFDGTVNGATIAAGKFGNGLRFDGVDDFVDCGNIGDVKTLSFWFKPFNTITPTTNATGIIEGNGTYNSIWLGNFTGSISNEMVLLATGGTVNLYAYWDVSKIGVNNFSNTLFHNLVITWSASNANYILHYNGKNCGLATKHTGVVSEISFTATKIGRRSASEYFKGTIDEVYTYSKALSSNDAKRIYCGLHPLNG